MKKEPDFIIPGASKSGTTSIHYYLTSMGMSLYPLAKSFTSSIGMRSTGRVWITTKRTSIPKNTRLQAK
jgi:hypothetical protein